MKEVCVLQKELPKFIDDFVQLRLSFEQEQREKLFIWHELLCKWQKKINLISPKTVNEAWQRHFMDSLQLGLYLPKEGGDYADLGSGAGFPGLAIALISKKPMMLIESDQKKSSFLRNVIRNWGDGQQITVKTERIENVREKFDVVSARALAPLSQLLSYGFPLLKPQACCLFLKGEAWQDEIAEAQKKWVFAHETQASLSNEKSVILKIWDIKEKI